MADPGDGMEAASGVSRRKKSRFWTEEEDRRLREFVEEQGRNIRWSRLPEIPGLERSVEAGYCRWRKYLKPGLNRDGHLKQSSKDPTASGCLSKGVEDLGRRRVLWTGEEDRLLCEFVGKHRGDPPWHRRLKIPGLNRSGEACRNRWTHYLKPDAKYHHKLKQSSEDPEVPSNVAVGQEVVSDSGLNKEPQERKMEDSSIRNNDDKELQVNSQSRGQKAPNDQ